MLQKGKLNNGTVHDLLSLKHTCVLTLCIILSIRASELLQLLSCRQVSWPIGWADIDLFRRFFTNWQWGWSFVKITKGIKRKTTRRTCHTKFNFNRKMQSTQHSVDLIWNPENVRTICYLLFTRPILGLPICHCLWSIQQCPTNVGQQWSTRGDDFFIYFTKL